jgi:hypothetical protein
MVLDGFDTAKVTIGEQQIVITDVRATHHRVEFLWRKCRRCARGLASTSAHELTRK